LIVEDELVVLANETRQAVGTWQPDVRMQVAEYLPAVAHQLQKLVIAPHAAASSSAAADIASTATAAASSGTALAQHAFA
jgi:hypothetical protein